METSSQATCVLLPPREDGQWCSRVPSSPGVAEEDATTSHRPCMGLSPSHTWGHLEWRQGP